MVLERDDEPTLRLWPGGLAVALQWLVWLLAPLVVPDFIGRSGAAVGLLIGAVAILVWWAFFSRAPRFERWAAVVLMIVALVATPAFLDESIREAGMGFLYFFYAIPVLCLAFVLWAAASRRLTVAARRASMIATILLACGVFALLRSAGTTGDAAAQFAWRWSETSEDRLLRGSDEPPPLPSRRLPARTAAASGTEWPGFRGAGRDGVLPGVRLDTDWALSPPVELWRRPIGPGASSFAASKDLLYTQEQRGDDEIVSCYEVRTGTPVWVHRDAARFWDPHVGAGPRATPALRDGRLYSFGATGILNALDATDGAVVWSRNAASDTAAEVPQFGFTSSPLVVDDLLIVYTDRLMAYDIASGDPRWSGPAGGESYSSPQRLTLGEVEQIVHASSAGAIGVSPDDGTTLWEHPWPGLAIVQPALTADGDLLVSTTGASGTRRISVTRGPDGWTADERWTSLRLKPSFSALVIHRGHAFGFDGNILASIDVEDGTRDWKGGRYGSGQLLLLPDQDVLLVLSERGELALVEATPDRFAEIARFEAIEGKTWSQPTLVGDVLLLRNGREMAAFRLLLHPN